MARQRRRKVLAAQKAGRLDEDSLLVQSAESLARVIGALQRQVHRALTKTGQDDMASATPAPKQRTARKLSGVKQSARSASTSKPPSRKPSARKTPRNRKAAHASKK